MREDLPPAILLDLDDTILNFMESAEPCWHAVARLFAGRFDGLSPEALAGLFLATRIWFWTDNERHRQGRLDARMARSEIVRHALAELGVSDPTLCDEISRAYGELREAAVAPFPGAVETLRDLKDQGVRLALVTNGGEAGQRRKLEQHNLAQYFELVVTEGEFGVGKPDPRIYEYTLDRMSVVPQDAWMVGDSLEWEVRVPQELGMRAIWLDLAGAGLPESSDIQPDRIIRSLRELIED